MSSADCLVGYNFHGALKRLKIGDNYVQVSNSLDLDEMQSYSAYHPEPSFLHMEPMVAIRRIGVNMVYTESLHNEGSLVRQGDNWDHNKKWAFDIHVDTTLF